MTFEKAEAIAKVAAKVIVAMVICVTAVLLWPFISTLEIGKPSPAPTVTQTVPRQTVTRQTARVTSDALNFRANPSGGARIIKTVKKGTTLTVTGDTKDGWIPVEHNGDKGWVSAKYVTLER